jgi:hypothetical protein
MDGIPIGVYVLLTGLKGDNDENGDDLITLFPKFLFYLFTSIEIYAMLFLTKRYEVPGCPSR